MKSAQQASLKKSTLSRTASALLMMVAAQLCFSLMLALIKAAQQLQLSRNQGSSLSASFGTWESVLFRCFPMALICLFVLLRRQAAGHSHPTLSPADLKWLLTRGVIGALSMACFFYGTLHIPLALASLFSNSSVFLIGILGHIFLSERLTRSRIVCALGGLAAVALILGTGHQSSNASSPLFPWEATSVAENGSTTDFLISFGSGILAAVAYFSVRKMKNIPSNTIILSLSLSGLGLALLSALLYAPLRIPQDPAVLALLCLSGIPAVIAQYLMTWSFQAAEAGYVALGQYSGPLFAALLGFVAFDETLNTVQWIGAGLAICFGILMPLMDARHRQSENH
jgi:drug/metabolite transporter (DMT)-like permease